VALSYLAQNCRASGPWEVRARPDRYYEMDMMPSEAINVKSAIVAMPPLIKGYLRLGARIGDGCVVDEDFHTVDVFVVLPVKEISARYINYYGSEAQRFAA
jgi:putative hemolysin